MEEIKKRGGAGLGQGRKKKSGKFIQFRPSQIVADILNEKKNMTAFIESAVVHYEDYLSVKIVSSEEFYND
jgi:hypothetical protein